MTQSKRATAASLKKSLQVLGNAEKAVFLSRFFRTGKGQYGEGDVFLGLTVPQTRSVVRNNTALSLPDVERLLKDPIHECRLAALLVLVHQYAQGNAQTRKQIARFYKEHAELVNNWDLVDSSAAQILGDWLLTQKSTALLDTFARSKNLWKQRIAIVATYAFIREHRFTETLRIAEILLHHPHDLIHKAVGWMLREMGKRDEQPLRAFLDAHAKHMPRTMLRYALEKFDEKTRKKYMANGSK